VRSCRISDSKDVRPGPEGTASDSRKRRPFLLERLGTRQAPEPSNFRLGVSAWDGNSYAFGL